MRIVIEVDGEKVTAIGPDTAPAAPGDAAASYGDPLPGPAPRELLERAKRLGAQSAGAAQFGRGAAVATATPIVAEPAMVRPPRKAASTKRKRTAARKRTARSR